MRDVGKSFTTGKYALGDGVEGDAHLSARLDLDLYDDVASLLAADVAPAQGLDVGEAQPCMAGEEERLLGVFVGTVGTFKRPYLFFFEVAAFGGGILGQQVGERRHGIVGQVALADGFVEHGVEFLKIGACRVGADDLDEVVGESLAKEGVNLMDADVVAYEGEDLPQHAEVALAGVEAVVGLVEVGECGEGDGLFFPFAIKRDGVGGHNGVIHCNRF